MIKSKETKVTTTSIDGIKISIYLDAQDIQRLANGESVQLPFNKIELSNTPLIKELLAEETTEVLIKEATIRNIDYIGS